MVGAYATDHFFIQTILRHRSPPSRDDTFRRLACIKRILVYLTIMSSKDLRTLICFYLSGRSPHGRLTRGTRARVEYGVFCNVFANVIQILNGRIYPNYFNHFFSFSLASFFVFTKTFSESASPFYTFSTIKI